MKYQINIIGMHCQGCKNLIQMSLEDAGFRAVNIDYAIAQAVFTSELMKDDVERLLHSVFKDLSPYKFANISIIT